MFKLEEKFDLIEKIRSNWREGCFIAKVISLTFMLSVNINFMLLFNQTLLTIYTAPPKINIVTEILYTTYAYTLKCM